MARTAQAAIKRFAIFVKERKNGREVYVRRPYDVVELNWGEGPRATYLQPHFGRPQSGSERSEVYDEVRVFDTPPDWDLCGRGSGL